MPSKILKRCLILFVPVILFAGNHDCVQRQKPLCEVDRMLKGGPTLTAEKLARIGHKPLASFRRDASAYEAEWMRVPSVGNTVSVFDIFIVVDLSF